MSLAETPLSMLSPASLLKVQPPKPPSCEDFHKQLLSKLAEPSHESRSEYLQWSRGKKNKGGVRGLSTPTDGDEKMADSDTEDAPGIDGTAVSDSGYVLSDPKILVPAAAKGDVGAVAAALTNARLADPNETGSSGHTALTAAASHGHAEIVALLLLDARTNPRKKSNNRFSPLLWAATNGHGEVVRCIVEDGRVDVNETTGLGRTPLHLAASGGHAEAVRQLLRDRHVNANQKDRGGATPLEVATERMHLEVINHLLADGRADQSSLKLRASRSLDEALGFSPTSPLCNPKLRPVGRGDDAPPAADSPLYQVPLYHVA